MNNRKQMKEDTRKLTFVVIIMSMFVLALYGLVPLV
jgi:hypothetical protein